MWSNTPKEARVQLPPPSPPSHAPTASARAIQLPTVGRKRRTWLGSNVQRKWTTWRLNSNTWQGVTVTSAVWMKLSQTVMTWNTHTLNACTNMKIKVKLLTC